MKGRENKVDQLIEEGKFYFLNQRYEEAIQQFQKAMILHPENPEIYYNLGIVYESINEIPKAKENFEKTLSLDSNFHSAQEHLEKLIGV